MVIQNEQHRAYIRKIKLAFPKKIMCELGVTSMEITWTGITKKLAPDILTANEIIFSSQCMYALLNKWTE